MIGVACKVEWSTAALPLCCLWEALLWVAGAYIMPPRGIKCGLGGLLRMHVWVPLFCMHLLMGSRAAMVYSKCSAHVLCQFCHLLWGSAE